MHGLLKVLLTLLIVVVFVVTGLLAWLWIAEYRPDDVETVAAVAGIKSDSIEIGTTYHMITMNIGYGGLGRDEDFFMDGGKNVQPGSEEEVRNNLSGILGAVYNQKADLVLLQEVDVSSKRSYYINEAEYFRAGLSMGKAFAYNFKVPFVPYPIPPIGKVESGLLTLSNLKVESAERVSLPTTSAWPVRLANLKRALLVEYLPIQDSSSYLVLVNLHLEAYTSDEAREEQMDTMFSLLKQEYKNGNYVIAGGDFNANFPGAEDQYPLSDDAVWVPGQLNMDDLPDHFDFAYDLSVPTCRALDKAYDGNRDDCIMYAIDGFIVSANVKVNSVQNIDLNFEYSDHQPVSMDFTLK